MAIKAIYVTYFIEAHGDEEPGYIPAFQVQVKGFAPKVADFPRASWESVVRYTICEDETFPPSIIPSCTVDLDTRELKSNDLVILQEDAFRSLIDVDRVENEFCNS